MTLIDLSHLTPAPGSKKRKKRVGRGDGSGHGKTSCRGHKGQRARAGGGARPGFEGGQMPLQRRVPKRGFKNPWKDVPSIVNIGQLELFEAGSDITPEVMRERGLVRSRGGRLKILGEGQLTKALNVKAHGFSAKAKERIEALGGTAELIAAHD